MPSTYTSRNRAEKQAPGENNNSWGALLNANTIDMFDQAIAGMAAYSLFGSKTLTTNNGALDKARCIYQNITGGTGGTITIPNVEKVYIVRNASSGTVTFTTGSGTTCTVSSGTLGIVVCEAGNVCRNIAPTISVSDITLGTLPVARGGTGVTTSTGTGNNVLSASPTFTGTVSGDILNFTGNASIGDSVSADSHTISGTVAISANGGALFVNSANSNSAIVEFRHAGSAVFRQGYSSGEIILTDASANLRWSVSVGATPVMKLNTTQVLTTRRTGWTAPSGTALRTGYDTSTATTTQLAQTLKALIDDLVTHGLIGS